MVRSDTSECCVVGARRGFGELFEEMCTKPGTTPFELARCKSRRDDGEWFDISMSLPDELVCLSALEKRSQSFHVLHIATGDVHGYNQSGFAGDARWKQRIDVHGEAGIVLDRPTGLLSVTTGHALRH